MQTRRHSALLQPQWEIPSPKPAELHPPQHLALACGLCWVRKSGVISLLSAGDHLWQLAATAAEHKSTASPDPGLLLHKAAGCMPWLKVLQPPPSTSCQDSWPCLVRIQLKQKPLLTRNSSIFIPSTRDITRQVKILPSTSFYRWGKASSQGQRCLNTYIGFIHPVIFYHHHSNYQS